MPVQGNIRDIYKAHLTSLKGLILECESFQPNKLSSLDPMFLLRERTQFIAQSIKRIVMELSNNVSNDLLSLLKCCFTDASLLKCYRDFLLASPELVFSINTPIFRSKWSSNFVENLIKSYSHLVRLEEIFEAQAEELKSIIQLFEKEFFSSYNNANREILRLDQVHNLLSHTFDIVSPPLIDSNKVCKRDFFRLSVRKLNIDHLLVEIDQFSNGELAIFRLNCGELPQNLSSPEKLLTQLLKGNYDVLDVGKTLLFPSLRKYDLEVVNLSTSSSIELKTSTGNNVLLLLQCIDPIKWEEHWKQCFKKLFDKNNIIPTIFHTSSCASLNKSSHAYQNFRLKLSKLQDLRPLSNEGLPIMLPSPVLSSKSDESLSSVERKSTTHQTGLHRSKPLQKPLSTLMSIEQDDRLNTIIDASPLILSPSLQDIELLSCNKLMALDKSIKMDLSPMATPESMVQRYKSVSQEPSLERITINSEKDVEESDLESFVSTEQSGNGLFLDEATNFNPSADIYKPTLYSRKSSSLLSLFSSKSKKSKEASVDAEKQGKGLQKCSNSSSVSSFGSVNAGDGQSLDGAVDLPPSIDLESSEIIFQNHQVRVSFWNNNKWVRIGRSALSVSILAIDENSTILVVHTTQENKSCKFVAKISPDWKSIRSSAQDVQITIPKNIFVVSVIPDGFNTLSLRCCQSEGLMNLLQHCIKGDLPAVMPKSATIRTMSSMPSSCMSNLLTRSSTAMSGLAESKPETINSYLLLPSLKVKMHCMVEGKGWHAEDIGLVDIYSQELKGTLIGMKFVITTIDKKSISLTSPLGNIQRIGRTGLLLSLKDNEKLLEFQNKLLADQVYRLVRP